MTWYRNLSNFSRPETSSSMSMSPNKIANSNLKLKHLILYITVSDTYLKRIMAAPEVQINNSEFCKSQNLKANKAISKKRKKKKQIKINNNRYYIIY